MNRFFLLGVLIVLLGAVLYFVQSGGTWQITKESRIPEEQGSAPSALSPAPQTSPETTQDLNSVANNLGQLAADFDTDRPFDIQGIWIQDSMMYVEYKNAKGVIAQLLVVKENGAFRGKGYFAPSESGWTLQAGEGDLLKSDALWYIKDSNGSWKRKN